MKYHIDSMKVHCFMAFHIYFHLFSCQKISFPSCTINMCLFECLHHDICNAKVTRERERERDMTQKLYILAVRQ